MSDIFRTGDPGAGLILALHPGAARASWADRNMAFHDIDAAPTLYLDGEGWFWKHWDVGVSEDSVRLFGGARTLHAQHAVDTVAGLYASGAASGPLLVVGHSEGAALAHELARTWAWVGPTSIAYASAGGGLVAIPRLSSSNAGPILHLHGTDDDTWPIEGGRILTGTWPIFARVPSAYAVQEYFGRERMEIVTHRGGHAWEPWMTERIIRWWRGS